MSRADRYASEDAGVVVTQCLLCRHRARGGCPAFPGGTPDAILVNAFDHRKPYPGQADGSILFAPRADADPGALRRLIRTLDALPS